MKRYLKILFMPLVWLWTFLRSGLTVVSNLLFIGFVAFIVFIAIYKPEIQVPANSALTMNLAGDIVEQRSPMDMVTKAIYQLTETPLKEDLFLQDILDTIQSAADDPRIKMMLLNTNRLGSASLDQLRSIGSAIDHFRKAGKQVIAYGDSFNQAQYYLAAWADKIYLDPMGAVDLHGFALFRLYLREMLDKLAIDFHVFRVGEFKSAVEPLLRNDMSPEAKEANRLWLGNLWNYYLADIARLRRLDPEVLTTNINQSVSQLASVGGDRGRLAVACGLVDGLKSRQEMETLLRELVGRSAVDKSFNHIAYTRYLQTLTPSYTDIKDKSGLIGIITATGTIVPGKGSMEQIGADDLIRRIRKARQDARVKAIVLRLNTGGGSAFASELIRQELAQARKDGKVVVISMASMAASGGYWLAADADAIVAAPTTLTGSIGIFGAIPSIEKSLAKLGIHGDGVATTEVAQFGNILKTMSADEQAFFQIGVEHGYRQFIEIVAKGRKMSPAQVEKIAEGRVWDGETAMKLGLVDRMGDLGEAVAEAARRAKVSEDNGWFIDSAPENFLERFKRTDAPVEALLGRLLHLEGLPTDLAGQVSGPIAPLLGNPDPGGIYAHSLLPQPAALLR